MVNRIQKFWRTKPLPRGCDECERRAAVQEKVEAARQAALEFEAVAGDGDVFELSVPTFESWMRPLDDDDDRPRGIRLYVNVEPAVADLEDDLKAYTIAELRRVAGELIAAADLLQGSAQP